MSRVAHSRAAKKAAGGVSTTADRDPSLVALDSPVTAAASETEIVCAVGGFVGGAPGLSDAVAQASRMETRGGVSFLRPAIRS